MKWAQWEREAWKPPPEETVDQWVERCLILPRGVSSLAGPLSLELTPYLREPLRAVTDPDVEELVLCTSSQVGKTTFLIGVALYYLSEDPWNIIHVMPSEDEAIECKFERYKPIILESPALRRLVKGDRGEFAGDVIRLNACTITFRGSHSPSALASKPAKILIADEIDKWDRWTGGEADPLDLLGERCKTFHDAKFLKCSTPTTPEGRIWRELSQSSNEHYEVSCPLCGAYQVLVFGDGTPNSPGIKWPEDVKDPEVIDRHNLAKYECKECRQLIDEKHKRAMLSEGRWAPKNPHITKKRGFHIWQGYSTWQRASWSKIAAKFLKSKGATSSLMNFRNSWQAETWAVVVHELKEHRLRNKIEPYKHGVAPEGAWMCTVGVDVQRAGSTVYQYYVIRAWGAEGKSWLLRAGTTHDWVQLYQVIFSSVYRDAAGAQLPIEIVLIDSGFETNQVYEFCDLYGCWASKGDSRARKQYQLNETESATGSGRYIRRVNFNADYYKSQLHNLINSGKWHLPEGLTDEYYSQMVAEQLSTDVEKSTGRMRYRWKLVADGRPNHYFDCEVLNLCSADILELQHRATKPPPPEEQQATFQPAHVIKDKVFS